MSLTDFLLARIEDDEAATLILDCRCGPGAAEVDPLPDCPDRVLADCVAKRAIVQDHEWDETPGSPVSHSRELRHLAAIYADHPDYLEEWKP